MGLVTWIAGRTMRRQPDFVIGPDHPEGPYMNRWWVIPRNPIFNIYMHQFLRSDEDFALHDHPWLFNISRIIWNRYYEHTIAEGGVHKIEVFKAGDWKFRWGRAPHRVELADMPVAGKKIKIECWTLFITGPVVREWGFHCPKGWVSFKEKIKLTKHSSSARQECQ